MVNRFYFSGRTFSADLSAPISLAATLRETAAALTPLEAIHISLEEVLREAAAAATPLAAVHISLEEVLREAAAFRNYLQTS